MALSAGVGYVDIRPVMTRFGQDLNRQLGPAVAGTTRAVDQVGNSLSSKLTKPLRALGISGPLAFAALGLAALNFGRQAFDAFQEARQVAAQTDAAIKSTGGAANVTADDVAKLAEAIRDYSGISDEAIQSAENMLLTFTNIRNEVGKNNDIFNQATEAVADLATRMANGAVPSAEQMKTASIQLGKALNDPIKGVTALARVGIQFTEEQKEQIRVLVESGETMKAQKVVLAELTRQFGGSAKALGEANPFGIIREQFGDVMEQLGAVISRVLEVVIPLATILMSALTPAVNLAAGAIGLLITPLTWLIDKLGPALQPALVALAVVLTARVIPAFVAWTASMGSALIANLGLLYISVVTLSKRLVLDLIPAIVSTAVALGGQLYITIATLATRHIPALATAIYTRAVPAFIALNAALGPLWLVLAAIAAALTLILSLTKRIGAAVAESGVEKALDMLDELPEDIRAKIVPVTPPPVPIPGAADGADILRGGLLRVHSGEQVVPAQVAPLSVPAGENHYHLHTTFFMGTPSEARRAMREFSKMQTRDMQRGLVGARL